MCSETDVRMFVQQGAFTLHKAESRPLDTYQRLKGALTRLVVPGESVLRLARQLSVCSLTEAGIYPDLDHLSAELTRVHT